jgi:hypothetical protein
VDFNRYAYAGNDPINFSDPNGHKITAGNPKDKKTIENYINKLASGTYKFNKEGELVKVKSSIKPGYSNYYSKKLDQAIGSKQTITISIKKTYIDPISKKSTSVDKVAGGGLTIVKKGFEVNVIISGKPSTSGTTTSGKKLTSGPAVILAHELVGHAIPAIGFGDYGNAVENENRVRYETGLPQREVEMDHVE